MGEQQSKPAKPMSNDAVIRIMNQYPEAVQQYFEENRDDIEKFVQENFWEEDVERWLKAIRSRSPKELLQVRKVDFLLQANKAKNNTTLFENKCLVIRRASNFDIDVHFGNRGFDQERDDIAIALGVGKEPSTSTRTKIICAAKKALGPIKEWSCAIASVGPKKMTLKINVPANAIVGRYKVSLDIVSGVSSGREKSTYKAASIIVLFNPFSKEDTVYMENESFRQEYVMNDEGFINVGTYRPLAADKGVRKKMWDFAQFDEGVLDAVLHMLRLDTRIDKGKAKAVQKCSSPAFVSRILAAMVNSNDDDGVLTGRWDGNYDGGATPSSWNSSADILLKWVNDGYTAVDYGQCWVFSGLMTTALRALGIPARSVTNYESAHDTDRNETIDIYMNANTFEKMDETSDSVWNFHVWNEGYFRRPNLPQGYDGWQVIDATPQELSAVAGSTSSTPLYQCGPAPVKAVKEGQINIGNDTAFIFSEVNADKVYWYINEEGDDVWSPTVMKSAIGKFIGTKAVGKYETENILEQYKYREGTPEERKAFNRAYSLGTQEHGGDIFDIDRKLVKSAFDITIDGLDDKVLGDPLPALIKVKNISRKKQEVEINISMKSKNHTGKIHALLKQVKETAVIEPGKTHEKQVDVTADEYVQNLVDNNTVSVAAVVKSKNFGNVEVKEVDTTLDLPDCIDVKAPKSVFGDEGGTVDIIFTNKSPVKLTRGKLRIGGRGFSQKIIEIGKPILPNETYTLMKEGFKTRFNWKRLYAGVSFQFAEMSFSKPIKIKVTM